MKPFRRILKPFRESLTAQSDKKEAVLGCDGAVIYVEIGGRRIAEYCGVGKWASLEPGWSVSSSSDFETIEVWCPRRRRIP